MEKYHSIFEATLKNELNVDLTYEENILYEELCRYIVMSNYGEKFIEFSLSREVLEKVKFIKDLAIEIGVRVKDLFKLFLNKVVFKFFKLIKWSFTEILNLLKKGFNIYKDLQNAIGEYLASTTVAKWTKEELKKLDNFLSKHPKVKKVAGIAVAGLLIYIWLTMSFTGHGDIDFDIDIIFQSLSGKFSLVDIFGTPSGINMLILFVTGAITGLGFPYPGSNIIKFSSAIIYTLAKKFKITLSKGKEKDVDKDLKDLNIKENKDMLIPYKPIFEKKLTQKEK